MDGKNIRKHKNDVFRLTELLNRNRDEAVNVSRAVLADIRKFINCMRDEPVDLKQLGIRDREKEDILDELNGLFVTREGCANG